MKDKRVACRLSVNDYNELMKIVKPFGGVGKWISSMLVRTNDKKEAETVRTKTESVRTKPEAVPDRKVNCLLKGV